MPSGCTLARHCFNVYNRASFFVRQFSGLTLRFPIGLTAVDIRHIAPGAAFCTIDNERRAEMGVHISRIHFLPFSETMLQHFSNHSRPCGTTRAVANGSIYLLLLVFGEQAGHTSWHCNCFQCLENEIFLTVYCCVDGLFGQSRCSCGGKQRGLAKIGTVQRF